MTEQWIPSYPRTTGYRSIELVQGRMRRRDGSLVPPLGVLLSQADASPIADEEIPREGVRVRRVPVLARATEGTYRRWVGRRVDVVVAKVVVGWRSTPPSGVRRLRTGESDCSA